MSSMWQSALSMVRALITPFVTVRCSPSMVVSRCVHGTHLWVVVGCLGEDVVHVVKRVIDDQGAQHALREGEMRVIDARVALCVW